MLSEAIAVYLSAMVVAGRSPCTIRNATCSLREFAAFMGQRGHHDVHDLTRDALLAYCARLSQRSTARGSPLCIASQCEYLGAIRSFCRWLVWEGRLPADPVLRIPQLRRRRRLPRSLLDPVEIALLCSLPDLRRPAGYRDRLILEILYSSALRRAEVANLSVADLDIRGGFLFIRHGKNDKDRVVPVGGAVCGLLERYIAEVRPRWPSDGQCTRVFLNRFGNAMHPGAVWHVVRKYVRQAGITKPVSTHTFRHSCATHMVRAGAPGRHLQELLGHSSLETTQIYLHLTVDDLKQAHHRFHPREHGVAAIWPGGLPDTAPCHPASAAPRR